MGEGRASNRPEPAVGKLSGFRIGDWTVVPALNQIERDGRTTHIGPLAAEVLTYLADRAGQVVSSETLIAHVWRGRVVGDGSVYQTVNNLRRAMNDDRQHPRYIQTVPKRGYRLVASVKRLEPQADHAKLTGLNVSVANGERTHRLAWRTIAIALSCVLALSLAFFAFERYRGEDVIAARDPSIAVLPFENLSETTEDDYLAAGIHDDLLTHLAKISRLKVISRTSVLEYAETSRSMQEIGEELGVATILKGSIQRADERIRVNTELIDVATDASFWDHSYALDLTAESISSLRSDLTTAIAAALQATLTPEEVASLNEALTDDTLAWLAYLRGNHYLDGVGRRFMLPRAIAAYTLAVTQDPQFAQASAALSRAYTLAYWTSIDRSDATLGRALEAVNKAFLVDPALPEAHLAMGNYYALGRRDFEKALEEYLIAQAGMPGDTELMRAIAGTLRRRGNVEGALEIMTAAIKVDPRNTGLLRFQAGTYMGLRNSAQARNYLDQVLKIRPDSPGVREAKVRYGLLMGEDLRRIRADAAPLVATGKAFPTLWLLGIHEQDFDAVIDFLHDAPDNAWPGKPKALLYAVTYRLAGQHELALAQFAAARDDLESRAERPEDFERMLDLAEAMVGLGDVEEGVRLAEEAMAIMPVSRDYILGKLLQAEAILRVFVPAGEFARATDLLESHLSSDVGWGLAGFLADPRLRPLRDDPRFQALVRRHGRGRTG